MLKGPVIFHRRLCVYITIIVLLFACFLILGAGIIFNYMCHKIIFERSEKAFIYLQQQNLINDKLSYLNLAGNPLSSKADVKKKAALKNKAVRKTAKRKTIKTEPESNVKSGFWKKTGNSFKAVNVFKRFRKFLSNMFNNKPDKAAQKLTQSPPKILFVPDRIKKQLTNIQGLELLFWYKAKEHTGYLWPYSRIERAKHDQNVSNSYKFSRKPGIKLLIVTQKNHYWKYQVRRDFGEKHLFFLEFDMTSLFKKFIVFSGTIIFMLIMMFLLVLWKVIYTQGNRLEEAINGLEDGMKEIFIGNYKNVLIEAREFVFTQRIANIMNQMIYFFNTHTERDQKKFQEDPLMKIYTRRYLMSTLEKEIIRAQRYQRPLVFIMADVDHFKKINDTYGHLMGDQVLYQTAKILKEHTRESDVIARYGGEEIAIILSETDIKNGLIVAEKLRRAVEKNKMVFQKQIVYITISLGVASLNNAKDTTMTLIHRADEALYAAKQNGRNRVCEKNSE